MEGLKAKEHGTPQGVTDRLGCVLPQETPNWNPNTEEWIKSLNECHVALLKGLHAAAHKFAEGSRGTVGG